MFYSNQRLLLLIAVMIPLFCIGQDITQPLRLSLQEAIELGLKNRPEIQNQQLNTRMATYAIRKKQSQYLPSVEASADFRYNTRLPTTVLPEGFFGTGNGPQLIRFGTAYNSVLSVTATQQLLKIAANQEVKMARKSAQIEEEVLGQVRAESKLSISEAYYTVLLHREEELIAQKTAERLRKYMDVTNAKLTLGTIVENELKRVQLDYLNADLSLKKSRQNVALSVQNLKNKLYLNPNQPIELTDSLYTQELVAGLPEDVMPFMENRPEIKQKTLERELSRLEFKKVASGVYPTLSAYANYSTQYQQNKLELTGKNAWIPFNYVGVQLNIPIFKGNMIRLEKQEYRLREQYSENSLLQQRRQISDELQTAKTQLLNAHLNLKYARQNYALAYSIYEVNLKKYELGSLLYNDLLDIEKSLTEAEKNLTTQTYELIMARLRWQRASGE